MKLHVAYDDRLLNWRLGKGHPTRPVRAKLAVAMLEQSGIDMQVHDVRPGTRRELGLVHTSRYINSVLEDAHSPEWEGRRYDLAETANLMFGGTMKLVDMMLAGEAEVCFSPMGAKHHAFANRSSGFCVLSDFGAAAVRLADAGHRVAVVDLDVHHGDGTEDVLWEYPEITTLSIHDGTIFPGTGRWHEPEAGIYNWALNRGDGDRQLLKAIGQVKRVLDAKRPTALLLAIGADGLANDPLGSLNYTQRGLVQTISQLAGYGDLVLCGGAGGYLATSETPRAWAAMTSEVVRVRSQVKA